MDNITIDKKELGKLIGAAKRVWTGAKKQSIALDRIEKNEGALLANDVTLAKMAKQKQLLDAQMVEHIDSVLIDYRGYDAIELAEKKQRALRLLLRDALCVIEGIDQPGKFRTEDIEDLKTRLENGIKDMEGAE